MPSNTVEVTHHDVLKEEDGGGDDETRSAFTGQGKGVESSPGAVGSGARVRGAEGPRDDGQDQVSDHVLRPMKPKLTLFVDASLLENLYTISE